MPLPKTEKFKSTVLRSLQCSDQRPCENCTSAGKGTEYIDSSCLHMIHQLTSLIECHASERVARKSYAHDEYTRSLEEKIAALESRASSEARNSSLEGETALEDDDANEQVRPEQENTSYVGRRELEDRDTQSLVIPTCEAPAIKFPPSFHSVISNVSPIAEDQCGHSTLLIGILATLTSGNPCGIASQRSDPWHEIILSSPIAEGALKPNPQILLPSSVEDALVEIYLERVNPRYPFLHAEMFSGWYKSWKLRRHSEPVDDPRDRWVDFFVTMVHAVSILLTPQVSQNDIVTSQSLYNAAMKYAPFVFSQPDPILHAQAYLLLTLHALHSPSSQMIINMVSITMRHCAINNLHRAECERQARFPEFSREQQIRRRVFWSAYALDRLISWIYYIPNNLPDEHITVEMFSTVEDASLHDDTADISQPPPELPQRTRLSPTLHLIRCRGIQSRILNTMMRSDFHKINATSTWREHMLEELESWRTHIKRLSHSTNRGYLSDRWVGMAYNYTVLILFQPNKTNALAGFGDRSVQACAQIALTFRAFQKDRQTAQLWPGLLSQFAIGVTLLYCFWATPPSYRTPTYRLPEVSEALRACSTALAILSERWAQAEPLRDVFDILAREIPIHETPGMDHSSRCMSTQSVSFIESQMHFMSDVVRN
ncbi:hypothetical protein N7526_009163 [Penicillium atrosanguineum]|nr:hypothetical protein N7526_009163 [Penicillium atrosanguineum]